jgi:ABC-type sugar transport system substrate-binding protein
MARRAGRLTAVAVALTTALAVTAVPVGAQQAPPKKITVMVIAGSSGFLPLLSQLTAAVEGSAAAIEKDGKVDFDVLTCDDGGDANKASQCTRDAVAQQVDAVFPFNLSEASAILPILEDAGIPAFWPAPTGRVEESSPISYMPSSATLAGYGMAGVGGAKLAKKGAIFTSDIARAVTNLSITAYEGSGATMGEPIKIPFGIPGQANAPDPSPYAAAAVAQDPEIVFAFSTADYIQALRVAGFDGPIVTIDAGTPEQTNAPLDALPSDITHDVFKASSAPPLDWVRPSKLSKQYVKEVTSTGDLDKADIQPYSYGAWIGAHALGEVVPTIPGDVTAASLKQTLDAAQDIPLVNRRKWTPSAPGPTGYTRDNNAVGYFSEYVGNSKWKAVKKAGGYQGLLIPSEVFETKS